MLLKTPIVEPHTLVGAPLSIGSLNAKTSSGVDDSPKDDGTESNGYYCLPRRSRLGCPEYSRLPDCLPDGDAVRRPKMVRH